MDSDAGVLGDFKRWAEAQDAPAERDEAGER